MKKSIFAFVLLLCLIILPVSEARSQTPETGPLGSFTELSGAVKYDKGGDTGYVELTKADALKLSFYPKDKILTPEATTGEIMISCGARLRLSQNTELQLGYYSIRINKGGIWVEYKPAKDDKGEYKFKVDTPVGTIGIKGTNFAVLVSPDGKYVTVQVYEGVVSFDSVKGSSIISGGELLTAVEGKNIEKPVKANPGTDILKIGETPEKDIQKPVEETPEPVGNDGANRKKLKDLMKNGEN